MTDKPDFSEMMDEVIAEAYRSMRKGGMSNAEAWEALAPMARCETPEEFLKWFDAFMEGMGAFCEELERRKGKR
jgi:hypothetical protein